MVALAGAWILTSCGKCKDVTCENGGTCSQGICECVDDFYGDACEGKDYDCTINTVIFGASTTATTTCAFCSNDDVAELEAAGWVCQ
tara:strand:- start:134 stop:394 length:261 start_codon:yes stop_codon:yes gene_type:complete